MEIFKGSNRVRPFEGCREVFLFGLEELHRINSSRLSLDDTSEGLWVCVCRFAEAR